MLAHKLIAELQHEAISTAKMLERIPADKLDWKPHEKSMTLGQLSSHIAETFGYVISILTAEELDFEGYTPYIAATPEEAVATFHKNISAAISNLEHTSDDKLFADWTLRKGDHVIMTIPRIGAIRGMGISHLIHHRGQLSVYLRMLDIPVPSIYGPSADEAIN